MSRKTKEYVFFLALFSFYLCPLFSHKKNYGDILGKVKLYTLKTSAILSYFLQSFNPTLSLTLNEQCRLSSSPLLRQ